jgi:hypothetical protein
LNESHQALENIRLNLRLEECRRRDEKLRENLRQCENEIHNEHSAANRSFWEGFFSGMGVLTLFVVLIDSLKICCWGVLRITSLFGTSYF